MRERIGGEKEERGRRGEEGGEEEGEERREVNVSHTVKIFFSSFIIKGNS
jgi:hypothetical protein